VHTETQQEVTVAYEVKKTEHAGAKNGGGYWGTRADAKKGSKKARRANDKAAVNA
jgi:hypothetical protein